MRRIIFALLCIFCFSSIAQAGGLFSDAISKKNNFCLSTPDEYKVSKDKNGGPFDYRIEKNKNSLLMVTPFWGSAGSLEDLRSSVNDRGKNLLDSAEEKSISLIELKKGKEILGFYYLITDKNYKPGEFKYLRQGAYWIDNGLVSFTFLNNEKETKEFDVILAILRSAKFEENVNYVSPFKKISISQGDLKNKVVFGGNLYVKTYQIYLYINKPSLYDGIIPKLSDIDVQSIVDGEDKGSVIYLKYNKGAAKAYKFLSGVFFGEGKPGSEEHPEEMFRNDDTIVILSYSTDSNLKKEIKKLIKQKMN